MGTPAFPIPPHKGLAIDREVFVELVESVTKLLQRLDASELSLAALRVCGVTDELRQHQLAIPGDFDAIDTLAWQDWNGF